MTALMKIPTKNKKVKLLSDKIRWEKQAHDYQNSDWGKLCDKRTSLVNK